MVGPCAGRGSVLHPAPCTGAAGIEGCVCPPATVATMAARAQGPSPCKPTTLARALTAAFHTHRALIPSSRIAPHAQGRGQYAGHSAHERPSGAPPEHPEGQRSQPVHAVRDGERHQPARAVGRAGQHPVDCGLGKELWVVCLVVCWVYSGSACWCAVVYSGSALVYKEKKAVTATVSDSTASINLEEAE